MLSQQILNTYVGRPIMQICPYGYDAGKLNHCAHFVSHVLQLRRGYTCSPGRGDSVCVRVQELFPLCSNMREMLECPTVGEGLIFVSDKHNFRGSPVQILNVPKKHVGIMLNGRIWHYSNTKHAVVVQAVGQFLSHYAHQQNALWFGSLPNMSRPTTLGTCA
jgi:hypothetical protein